MTEKKQAKGVLPSKEWLVQNGYRDLVKCMEEHPEKFAHIKLNQEPKNKEM